MKKFVEKLIGRLEEATHIPNCSLYCGVERKCTGHEHKCGLDEMRKQAIEIVNQLAKEYNNGWIPVSERLPEVNGKYLVCVDNPTRNKKNCIFAFWFNAYDKEFDREHDLDNVLAWQPLPAPYRQKEDE